MSRIFEWLPIDGWPRFAADAIWQSTLVGLIALCVIHLVVRRPATRALVSVIGIMAAVLLPIASAASRSAGWGVLSAPIAREELGSEPVATKRPRIAAESVDSKSVMNLAPKNPKSADSLATRRPLSSRPKEGVRPNDDATVRPSTATIFATFWAGLSAVMFIRLLRGALHTRRLLKEAVVCSDSNVVNAIHEAAQRIGIAPPRVCFSAGVSSPTVFAFGRGLILLPPTNKPATAARDFWLTVFCHELGHIRRRDGWNRVVVEVMVCLLPWQPLVWLLRRAFLHHSEEACDDWAVATGADPVALASILTDFVPCISRPHLGAAIMTTDAKTRILRLLALRETPRPRTSRLQLAAILAAAMIIGGSVALAQRNGGKEPEPNSKESKEAAAVQDTKGVASDKVERFVYMLEPPDIVSIEPVRLVSKAANRVETFDRLLIEVVGALSDAPIKGEFTVDADGEVNLGPPYGRVEIAGATVKEAEKKVDKHLSEILAEPQVALSIKRKDRTRHVSGQADIEPDGHIRLGDFGRVYISGMTVDEAREVIEKKLGEYFENPKIALNIHAHKSKVYYIIVEGNGTGDNITRYPWNGSENVLDAIAQQKDLLIRTDTKIWIARPADDKFQILNIDWAKLKSGEIPPRRYRLNPGDRIFVSGATWKSAASAPAKAGDS